MLQFMGSKESDMTQWLNNCSSDNIERDECRPQLANLCFLNTPPPPVRECAIFN